MYGTRDLHARPNVLFDYGRFYMGRPQAQTDGRICTMKFKQVPHSHLHPPSMQNHPNPFRAPTWLPLLSFLLLRRSSLRVRISKTASTMSTRPTKNAAASAPAVDARYCHTCGRVICESWFCSMCIDRRSLLWDVDFPKMKRVVEDV